MEWKTYFTDGLVSIAILLSLFRTDWNHYLNSSLYDGYPEIQEIIMGPLSGYTQTYIHANEWHLGSIGLSHPKSMSLDYSSSIFNDIHSLARYQQFNRHDTEIDAFLVGDTQSPLRHPQNAHSGQTQHSQVTTQTAPGDTNNNHAVSNPNNGTNSTDMPSPLVEGALGPDQDRAQSFAFEYPGAELTKEDMELIEILWRQDIDLGVGRDAYDATRRQELEKQRENHLAQQAQKENELEKEMDERKEENNNNNVTYTVDEETGEFIPVPASRTISVPTVIENQPIPQQQALQLQLQRPLQQPLQQPIQQPLEQPQNAEQNFSMEEAMHMLESGVDQFNISDSGNVPLGTFNDQLNELDSLINNVADMYGNQSQPRTLQHQDSIEQHWSDISNWLPIDDAGNDTALAELSTLLDSYTATNGSDLGHNSIIQNASLASQIPVANLSFNEGYNFTSPGTQMSSINNLNESLHLVPTDSLGLQNTSLSTTAAYVNSTDTLLQHLLNDDMADVDFTHLNMTDGIDRMETNDTTESTISSADSASLLTTSPTQDLSDTTSNISSPYDTLEGATGGSDADGSTSSYSTMETKHKYDAEYTYGQMTYDNDDINHLNHSDASNSSFTRYEAGGSARQVQHNHTYPLQPGQSPKERKTKAIKDELDIHDAQYTRDQKRAKSMKVPFTMEEMINSPVETFNEMLEEHRLSDTQLQLIRDIRRRGKNKVAAQNCRKRKLEVIQTLEEEVEKMRQERDNLRSQRRGLEKESTVMKHKYSNLYEDIFRNLRDDQGHPYDPNEYALQQNDDGEVFLVPHNATSCIKDEPKRKESRKRKNDRKGH